MKKTSLLLCEAAEVDTHEAQITAVLFTTTTASTAGLDLQHTPIDFSSLYYIRQLWRPYSLKKCLLKRGESSSNAGPVLPPPTTLFSTGIVVGGELKTCTLILYNIFGICVESQEELVFSMKLHHAAIFYCFLVTKIFS
jgi:hypothetical protein